MSANSSVIIYTTDYCPYCTRAKNLMEQKGITYEEKMLSSREDIDALKEKTGMMTVPQIFINDKLIGGYTELAEMDRKGELDNI